MLLIILIDKSKKNLLSICHNICEITFRTVPIIIGIIVSNGY